MSPSQSWAALANQPAQMATAGTPLASSSALTAIEPVPAYSTAAGDIYPGKAYLLWANGVLTTLGTSATLKIGFYYGTTATSLADTGTPIPAASATNWPWHLEALVTCRTVGTSGTMWTQGTFNTPTSATAWNTLAIPSTTPAAVTVDTTIAKNIGVLAQWSLTTAYSITCHQFAVVPLN